MDDYWTGTSEYDGIPLYVKRLGVFKDLVFSCFSGAMPEGFKTQLAVERDNQILYSETHGTLDTLEDVKDWCEEMHDSLSDLLPSLKD